MSDFPAKEPSVTNHVELLLKLGTVILAVTYVLGLLITNAQLLQLGLADFSSLQTRNIMTGFLFLFYLLSLFLLILPIPTALVLWFSLLRESFGLKRKLLLSVFLLAAFLIVEFALVTLGGTIMGYLSPSGRSWSDNFNAAWTWKAQKLNCVITLNQCLQAFWRQRTVLASAILALGIAPIMYELLKERIKARKRESTRAEQVWSQFRKSYLRYVSPTLLVGILPLLLFDYADEVYPNLQYNFGGGQPRIVRLDVERDKTTLNNLLSAQSHSTPEQAKTIISDPVALWYKDDTFLYVSPLIRKKEDDVKVLAVDSKIVHTIYYVAGYVKVGSSGRILSTHLSESTFQVPNQ